MQRSKNKKIIKTYRDLNVYNQSYKAAMEIFNITRNFPREEVYSLTNQIRRSSRSIAANIAEGWAKRKYENVFLKHLHIANGSCEETKVWLQFAKDCKYMNEKVYTELFNKYNKIGAMLYSMLNTWRTFKKKNEV